MTTKRLRKALRKREVARHTLEAAVLARFDQQGRVQRAEKRLTARKADELTAQGAFNDATAEVLAAAEEIGR